VYENKAKPVVFLVQAGEFVGGSDASRGSHTVIYVDEKPDDFRKYIFERAMRSEGWGLTVLTDDADSCLLRG
jgi:hypothetical protein